VVAAAGNGGGVTAPGLDPYVVTVDALDPAATTDPVPAWSGRGPDFAGRPKPDLHRAPAAGDPHEPPPQPPAAERSAAAKPGRARATDPLVRSSYLPARRLRPVLATCWRDLSWATSTSTPLADSR
jgi:hypothetical protein